MNSTHFDYTWQLQAEYAARTGQKVSPAMPMGYRFTTREKATLAAMNAIAEADVRAILCQVVEVRTVGVGIVLTSDYLPTDFRYTGDLPALVDRNRTDAGRALSNSELGESK